MNETQTIEQFVEEQLQAGVFNSYNEMVAEGLRLLQEKIRTDEALAEEFRPAIEQADSGYAGVSVSLEEVKRLSEKYLAEERTGA